MLLSLERLGEVSVLIKIEKNSFLFSASSSPKQLGIHARFFSNSNFSVSII